MYSVLEQTKTALLDSHGLRVYRRLYLCDTLADVEQLPTEDAPGSGAVVANGGSFYLLDNNRKWYRADSAVAIAECLYKE